jgi:hypothetical protein
MRAVSLSLPAEWNKVPAVMKAGSSQQLPLSLACLCRKSIGVKTGVRIQSKAPGKGPAQAEVTHVSIYEGDPMLYEWLRRRLSRRTKSSIYMWAVSLEADEGHTIHHPSEA